MANTLQSTGSAKTEKRNFFASNPVMRRLSKISERTDTNTATYSGITGKTVYFLAMTILGVAAYYIINLNYFSLQANQIPLSFNDVFKFQVTMTEMISLIAVIIVGIITQTVAAFARKTIPVTGAVYCVTRGYVISFLVFKFLAPSYSYLGLLTLAITLLTVLVMSILYTTGVIKVTKKFKVVMLTLFITAIAVSALTFIASLIPFTRELVSTIMGNPVISIGFTVLFIITGALFLISDFSMIDDVITQGYPREYE